MLTAENPAPRSSPKSTPESRLCRPRLHGDAVLEDSAIMSFVTKLETSDSKTTVQAIEAELVQGIQSNILGGVLGLFCIGRRTGMEIVPV